jgi:hypothetical protein
MRQRTTEEVYRLTFSDYVMRLKVHARVTEQQADNDSSLVRLSLKHRKDALGAVVTALTQMSNG